jgi:hypothetical protein
MSDSDFKPSIMRRLWVVILMTCLLIPMPVGMIVLLTGSVYRKRDGTWQPIGNGARYLYGGILAVWLVAATLKAVLQPGGIQGQWERSADPASATQTTQTAKAAGVTASSSPASQEQGGLPTCDNPEVIQTAREAIDESPAGTTLGLRVRDVGKGQETFYEPARKVRRCVAEAMLNNGSSLMTYQVLYGPSGNLMVQAQVGDSAVMQHEVDKAKKEEAEAESRPRNCTPYVDNLTGKNVYPYGCEEQQAQTDQQSQPDQPEPAR